MSEDSPDPAPDLGPGLPAADVELDCRGLRCPRPVIELARALPGVPVGGVLAVVSTDVASAVDVPAWARMRGQDYLGADRAADGVPRYVVRRLA